MNAICERPIVVQDSGPEAPIGIEDPRINGIREAVLAPNAVVCDRNAMEMLDIRATSLSARKGYLYCALVVLFVGLIFAAALGKLFIAAGLAGGLLLLWVALRVNQSQISGIQNQIQVLVKTHPQNPDVFSLQWGTLHSRLKRERKCDEAKRLAGEYFETRDRSYPNIRSFVLDLKNKGFFDDEETDPMGAVSQSINLRPLLIHRILDGADLFESQVRADLQPYMDAYRGPSDPTELIQKFCKDNQIECQATPETVKRLFNRWISNEQKEKLLLLLIENRVFNCSQKQRMELNEKFGIPLEMVERLYCEKAGSMGYFPLIDQLEREGFFIGEKGAITYTVLRENFGIPSTTVYEYRQSLPNY